ncbi:hypothetical protein BEL04_22755 [Mucilaginibacter sp. PPCGB 2223]|uniref:DUF4197 domain-containing protein n=1 Tax=Mucilaginibacter sp. PPCGB 2223 TaxID=1886027 RepID=UPI000826528A|nr:DUF4197 domain-containing protein [Mucilaginibacter sp. PPCGB 2223]OCX50598.1 hypothetical protein BEL04_22755 [Mucilaginibacter sp. PPCGB 2223]
MTKAFRIPVFALLLLSSAASAQIKLPASIKSLTGGSSGSGTPTTLEIGTALKDALTQGTTKSSDKLSAVDGFFGDAAVKILFPPEAQKVESRLRQLGQGALCDKIILSLNRAAEDAAGQAKPIFIDAIKQMTLDDVQKILLGSNDSATQYFRRTTTTALVAAFKPVIEKSLGKTGATQYYSQGATIYNKIPFVSKVNPDIVDYACQKTVDGLFIKIAAEELNIRTNIGARPNPVMQKVFGFAATKM